MGLKDPHIHEYGYIGDCHSSALVSKYGSIDWCCMPRVDSPSCFTRLLDNEKGGYCLIAPTKAFRSYHQYRDNTMILETYFVTKTGTARVIDFFSMRAGGQRYPYQQIIRIVQGISGRIEFKIQVEPRFDYGTVIPWIKAYKATSYIAMGGSNGLLFSSSMPLISKDNHCLEGLFLVKKDQKHYFSIQFHKPEKLDGNFVEVTAIDELDWRLSETENWWRAWYAQGTINGPYADYISRSALVLKTLANAPTGAIAAAPTTSLPESFGGIRNWDYRYTWIRDSYFTVRSLNTLGFVKEAEGLGRFIMRTCHSSAAGLQTLYGVAGETRLEEYTIDKLSGYKNAKPVRIGNAAVNQLQFDMYGELLDLAWLWFENGFVPSSDFWKFIVEIINFISESWHQTDSGIWEIRDNPRHLVLSKVMCWVALDRGIKLAKYLNCLEVIPKWTKTHAAIRRAVETKGYDQQRGVFTQAFGVKNMDASLLLMPMYNFIDFNDERMIRTTDAIWQDLQQDGLLLRYPHHSDGLPGKEGVFLACSFWLVICLAKQNRHKEAHQLFKRALKTGNKLKLFSEEYDTKRRKMLGNFPQGLTHLSLIAAAITLQDGDVAKNDQPISKGS